MTSPRWKWPCTSIMPIGSRLLPSSRSFSAAPSSTTTAPRSCRWSTIHCLRAVSFGVSRQQRGADGFARGQAQQHVGLAPPGDHGAGAAAGGALGRQHLGEHAAAADATNRRRRPSPRAPDRRPWPSMDEARPATSLRGSPENKPRWSVRMTSASASTRLATSAASVSLSPNLISSLTTVSFSLITGMTLQRQQRQQRRAGVEVALAVRQVGVRQQHLRAAQAVFAQLRLVHLHQAHLADGGGGLQFVQFLRPRRPAQALHALGDGAAGDHHQLAPLMRQHRQLPAPVADGGGVEAAALVGDQAGADLDDDAPRLAQHLSHGCGCRRRATGSKRGSARPAAAWNCATCA